MQFLRSIVLALALLLLQPIATHAGEDAFSSDQKTALEAFIRDYLLKNPEILVEALTLYQQREEAAQKSRQSEALVALRGQLEDDPDDPFLGNPDGDVTVVEFFDYQCSYCKSMLKPMQNIIARDRKIRWVLKEFPVLGPASVVAAQASLAAREQGKYRDFHIALMGYRGRLDRLAILQVAREVGLDINQLRTDMDSPRIAAMIDKTRQLAEALGVRGTPAFAIGNTFVPGAVPPERLAELIAAARES